MTTLILFAALMAFLTAALGLFAQPVLKQLLLLGSVVWLLLSVVVLGGWLIWGATYA